MTRSQRHAAPRGRQRGHTSNRQLRTTAPATQLALPEVVVAFVAPVGTKLAHVRQETVKALKNIGYRPAVVKVTDFFAWSLPHLHLPARGQVSVDVRYEIFMDAGDELRLRMRDSSAAALPTLQGIAAKRSEETGDSTGTTPAPATAFLVDSLKTPEEVKLLRGIYGARFVLIAAYGSETRRIVALEDRIRTEPRGRDVTNPHERATELVKRDQEGATLNQYGQNVRDAFAQADCVVDADEPKSAVAAELYRFFSLLFRAAECAFYTPTSVEQSMFLAAASSMRSSSLSRQVGAVVVAEHGSVISIGTNEAPKHPGGAYWDTDDERVDGRSFRFADDPSKTKRDELLSNVMRRLEQSGWSPPAGQANLPLGERVERFRQWQVTEAQHGGVSAVTLDQLTEFNREVHAEMLAITDAARRGVSVQGSHLVTTTFPCDDCAKHAVAAGISEITFLEPYAKSLIRELHSDSLHVQGEPISPRWERLSQLPLKTFVGVAPRRYMTLFRMSDRAKAAVPRLRIAGYEGVEEIAKEETHVAASITDERLVYVALLKRLLEIGGIKVDESKLP